MQLGPKSEEPVIEPYPIFKLHAGDDEELNYDEFCALLDRFDIEMIEDRRRMFFAKVAAALICALDASAQ